MSAPQQGRQSPEPEAQSDAQQGSVVESGKVSKKVFNHEDFQRSAPLRNRYRSPNVVSGS